MNNYSQFNKFESFFKSFNPWYLDEQLTVSLRLTNLKFFWKFTVKNLPNSLLFICNKKLTCKKVKIKG